MHLPQVQIYAVTDALLNGDVIVIFVTAVSIVNILSLLSSMWLEEPVNVCFPFQFYQEELGQERLRIEQEMQVGSEFWSTQGGAVLKLSTECQSSITDPSNVSLCRVAAT